MSACEPHDSGYLAIELPTLGSVIGQIGLFSNPERTTLALGYLIDEPHWGFGFATEAAKAIITESQRRFPQRQIVAVIPDGHVASERVAGKLGMVPTSAAVRNQLRVRRWILPEWPGNRH